MPVSHLLPFADVVGPAWLKVAIVILAIGTSSHWDGCETLVTSSTGVIPRTPPALGGGVSVMQEF